MRLPWSSGGINWRYAIGEVLLIVIGVLIALTASDWQDRRVRRQNETALLREIHSSLSVDLDALEAQRDRFRQLQSRLDVLVPYLQSSEPYADSLDVYFGSVYGSSGGFEPNTAAYESLRSQGIQLISNQALRSHIARVYEQTYSSIDRSLEIGGDVVLQILRPYFLQHFRDLRFGQNATPLDYSSLRQCVDFQNVLSYRLQVVRQNHLPRFDRGISEVRDLIDALEQELGT